MQKKSMLKGKWSSKVDDEIDTGFADENNDDVK